MGIRSDVAVCVKSGSPIFEKVSQLPLLSEMVTKLETEEGAMWIFNSIKWYKEDYSEIKELYAVLQECPKDCLVVAVCPEYPGSENDDFGEWDDNPWNVYRYATASLEWDQ